MSIPVINPTVGINGYPQWLTWQLTLTATNNPTSWRAEGLPPGILLDAPTQYAVTGVASTDVITATGSAFANGDRVIFDATLAGGAGLLAATIYYVVLAASATFKLAATYGGAAINFTTNITAGNIGLVQVGRISGAGTVPGLSDVTFIAANADGDSLPLVFPIGIEVSATFVNASMGLIWDLQTDLVSSDSVPGAARDAEGKLTPIAFVKEGSNYLLIIRVQKAGAAIDMTLSTLQIGLKQNEPDPLLVLGGGDTEGTDFKKFGSGSSAYWVLPFTAESDQLKGAIADYEDDNGTFFNALFEIEMIEAPGISGHNWAGIGPDSLRRASRTFAFNVERNLIP